MAGGGYSTFFSAWRCERASLFKTPWHTVATARAAAHTEKSVLLSATVLPLVPATTDMLSKILYRFSTVDRMLSGIIRERSVAQPGLKAPTQPSNTRNAASTAGKESTATGVASTTVDSSRVPSTMCRLSRRLPMRSKAVEPVAMHSMKQAKTRPCGKGVALDGAKGSSMGTQLNTKVYMAPSKRLCTRPRSQRLGWRAMVCPASASEADTSASRSP
mmetsp:Transcript_11706/g.40009  ORF Transcript_11706/g.40009 Transcript_11706/m.40009 type:complete len:217 (-) Transcript_11706:784-1434(-)